MSVSKRTPAPSRHSHRAALHERRFNLTSLKGIRRLSDRQASYWRHHTAAGRRPIYRDLASFDFNAAKVDEAILNQRATLDFTDTAHNVVLVGGTGTGETRLATALSGSAIQQHGERVRFYSIVELFNTLELEKAAGKQGRLAYTLMRADLLILDELGYLLFRSPVAPCSSTCYPRITSTPVSSSPPT